MKLLLFPFQIAWYLIKLFLILLALGISLILAAPVIFEVGVIARYVYDESRGIDTTKTWNKPVPYDGMPTQDWGLSRKMK